MYAQYTCTHTSPNMHACTVIYQLIAALTITFSKLKCSVTKRGWPLNFCSVPGQQHLYCTYILDVIGGLYQITRTYS